MLEQGLDGCLQVRMRWGDGGCIPPTQQYLPTPVRTSIKLLNMYKCECMKGDGLTEEHCCDRCLTGDGSRISIADLVANKAKYHQSWGWTDDSPPIPVWITKSPMSRKLPKLGICTCATQDCTKCKCVTNNEPCTMLCGCKGKCRRSVARS